MIRLPVALSFAASVAALMLAAPVSGAERVHGDAKLMAAATAARASELSLLEQIVNIDSGTFNVEGGEKIQGILADRLKAMGAAVELIPAEAPGLPPNLVATFTGKGKGRVLLIGHVDTVLEKGEAARRPFKVVGDTASGPGVMDEKGGVVTGITALQLLHDLKRTDYGKITFLIETSEEDGSTGTRRLIDRLVREHDVELNLEPEYPDTLTVWRKSSANLVIRVHGKPAHAGMEPQNGRNAADELMHQIQLMEGAFPRSGDHITVNLTLLKAGSRSNIIPEFAEATLNVRGRTLEEMESVGARARDFAAHPEVSDTKVEITYSSSFPPLVANDRVLRIAAEANRARAEFNGGTYRLYGNGGASESALADAAGTPTLDGLGSTGSGAHTPQESLDLKSYTERLYVLTRLIEAYGARPPSK
jgi:glutamate carboxypeptidase